VTGGDTDRIAHAFIARTLPKPQWTHQAHLKVGLWHALRYPLGAADDGFTAPKQDGSIGADAADSAGPDRPKDLALDLLRDRIRAYNETTGVPNTATGGYHETITRFYLMIIRRFLASADLSRPVDDLAAELILAYGDRELPLRYYSKNRLFSTAARAGWLPPDTAV
jgi:hypothetical protein